MGWFAIPLIVAVAASLLVAGLLWSHRGRPGARALALLLVFSAIWAWFDLVDYGLSDLQQKLLVINLQYSVIVSVAPLWLIFAWRYASSGQRPSYAQVTHLFIVPAITLALLWTNDAHGFMRRDVRLDTSGSFAVVAKTYGPWFWVFAAYSYGLLIYGTYLITRAALRSPGLYRAQLRAILVGALAPWLGNLTFLIGQSRVLRIDPTPIAFAVSGAALTWGLCRYGLFDIVPMAYERVIEEMSDGLVVLDGEGRIVQVNPAAEEALAYSRDDLVGRRLPERLSAQLGPLAQEIGASGSRTDVALQQGVGRRDYDVSLSALHDRRGGIAGQVAMLRDITARKRAEEERESLIRELQEALGEVKRLSGLLPICAWCKRIRTDEGYWKQLEEYLSEHSNAVFTHGICPDCQRKLADDPQLDAMR